MTEKMIALETSHDTLQLDAQTGQLISFRSKAAPDQEFMETSKDDPVFVIQYLDEAGRFRQIASTQAQQVQVASSPSPEGSGGATLCATFRQLAGLDLHATVTVRASGGDRFSRWRIAVENGAGLRITDVAFPVVVIRYALGGETASEALLWPFAAGRLLKAPKPQQLEPDSPHAWQMRPENGDNVHYPGLTMAQFLAYYNDRAGILISCQDASGKVKQIKPVHHEPGLRLGIAHVGDWPREGTRELEYDVVLGSFGGDWTAAADLYRDWSLQQPWAQKPLHARDDVPDWLLDSPPHIILRIQGELDIGPALPNEAFLPYAKMIPMLDALSERIDAPLVPVIMSWERPGPWIYPDCFPPAGGADALKEFTALARQRGWRVGSFCNGTRWVVGHHWSGYDGQDYFEAQNGAQSVCRTHEGDMWEEKWDATWRPSYACCLGVPMTHEIGLDFIQTLTDLGLDWIQFLDQNVGCCTLPCFASDHGHPPEPGAWMTTAMEEFVQSCAKVGESTLKESDGERQMIFSVEATVNEYFLQDFQLTDVRVVPPGHKPSAGFVPLYHYLYHEFIVIQGGFGMGPEPYHMPIRNAYNLVVGEIPGGVMIGDGSLLNYDTMNWAPWDPTVGDNEASLEMLRCTAALRRGPAKDFLVYGRMMPPARVEGIRTMRWQRAGTDHQIPAVFHAAWQAPDGRLGLVLANWTEEAQETTIVDSRLGKEARVCISAEEASDAQYIVAGGGLEIVLPPLSCALVESWHK